MKITKLMRVLLISLSLLIVLPLFACNQSEVPETTASEKETTADATETTGTETETTGTETETTVTETETTESETETTVTETETTGTETETTVKETDTTKSETETSAKETDTTKPETETSAKETDTTRPETETTSSETETVTDVVIGETLEAEYATDFTVAKVFSNDMVVQREEHIRVWGFAPESENGKKVSGEFKGMFAEALIENGEWCLTFGARLEADVNGAEMKIYTDKKTITFEGVLVGDVYLVIGQSNIAYTVNQHIEKTNTYTQGGGLTAIDQNSIIRLNHLSGSGGTYANWATDYVYSDLENTKLWTKTTAKDTLTFSALGYYFAKAMVDKTGGEVPIGVMEVDKAGAPLGSFLPNELAEKYDTDYYYDETGKYHTHRAYSHYGRYLYNCYLAPVERYAIAGVIWYQGESNNSQADAMKYNQIFAEFMTYMRSTHNLVNKDFPVFVVEMPSIYEKPASFTGTWNYWDLGIIRSYMGTIPTVLKNSYVSASSDLWNDETYYDNIHPGCKYEQAQRLAELASVVVCKQGLLENATGPIFESAQISADKKTVIITFANVGIGLGTISGGADVKGIVGLLDENLAHTAIAPISARITSKNQVTVTFSKPVKAVAYNFYSADYFDTTLNLCNSSGCPATAFISPCSNIDFNNFTADKIVDSNFTNIGLIRASFDNLMGDEDHLLTPGGIVGKLEATGNKVTVSGEVSIVSTYGWVGFKSGTLALGYSVDGETAKFSAPPVDAEAAVINAGGEYACRFTVNIDVSGLELGLHTVQVLALIDYNGGTAVEILTFQMEIVG